MRHILRMLLSQAQFQDILAQSWQAVASEYLKQLRSVGGQRLQEIRSVKDKPFYCQSSARTMPARSPRNQGHVFLQLAFCKQTASLQQLVSHMATVCLSTNRHKHGFY